MYTIFYKINRINPLYLNILCTPMSSHETIITHPIIIIIINLTLSISLYNSRRRVRVCVCAVCQCREQ